MIKIMTHWQIQVLGFLVKLMCRVKEDNFVPYNNSINNNRTHKFLELNSLERHVHLNSNSFYQWVFFLHFLIILIIFYIILLEIGKMERKWVYQEIFYFFYFLDKRCYWLKGILKLKGENITFLFLFLQIYIYIYIQKKPIHS